MSLAELLGFKKWERGPSPFKMTLDDSFLYGNRRYSNRFTYEDLMNAESELGKTIFGPIPVGHERAFFKNRGNTWIWHESWTDALGAAQSTTITYDVRPEGVFKKVPGTNYQKIEGSELENFVTAARTYYGLVKDNLYS
ncbi:hypothetical protein IKT18_02945 [Candidatus Saccharibacteria bacterium]|nr:hypothetical protein [Candidatus Saccharibacteria bacterium]